MAKKKKPTIYVDYSCSAHDEILSLVKLKKSFIVKRTNRTTQIEVDDVRYIYSELQLKPRHFSLMKEVKNEFLAHEKEIRNTKIESPFDINYNDFSDTIKDMEYYAGTVNEFHNIINMDITKAYYYSARNLGYISPEFFKKCMNLPKYFRLILIGSVATNKRTFHYEKGELVEVENDSNELLREAWFNICKYVDNAMTDIKNCIGKHFLFYWVDGIFFTPNNGQNVKICHIIMDHYKFDFTLERIKKIEVVNDGAGNIMKVFKGKSVKTFTVPRQETKAYYFDTPAN